MDRISDNANLKLDFEIALIEPIDDPPPKKSIKQAVVTDYRIELPISQPTTQQLISGTLILAVVATVFLAFILWFSNQQKAPPSSSFKALMVLCWIIVVVGPILFWLAVPNGILKPDHWLRYDRKLAELSIRGGYSILKHDETICMIAISDQRKKKQQSELQVISKGTSKPVKHFVLNSQELDPRQAFGTVLEQFAEFAQIPRYYAIVDASGETSIIEDERERF